ncbi:MAG: histidine phosphatase family protein [Myxococcota bacterium]
MDLLVIRHDVAEPRDPTGGAHADAQRALSDSGRKRVRRAARALARLVGKVDVLASSGLLRADETANAIAEEFGGLAVERVAALAPGAKPEAVADWLRGLAGSERVAIVGHEPGLSRLVCWLVSGLSNSWLELGKGGACLVEIPGRIAPGEARLAWLLRPGQLRRLR